MIYLITGKAGAGKTHYARALTRELQEEGRDVRMIDGDDLRVQQSNQDYTDAGRVQNLMYAAELAKRYEQQDCDVVLAFIAPRRIWRSDMRRMWKQSVVVYIPGGSLWEGTTYEKPTDDEFKVWNFID